MAMVSFVHDTDSVISASPFKEGQIAIAHDSNKIYVDVMDGSTQKRVTVQSGGGTTVVASSTTPTGNFKTNDVWLKVTE